MDDFKIIARLLAAIRAGEDEAVFPLALIGEGVLRTTAQRRDSLALKLQKAGYIEGLYLVDGIDNAPFPVILWDNSHPTITLRGLEYIQETKPLQKAIGELAKSAAGVLPTVIMNALQHMMGG